MPALSALLGVALGVCGSLATEWWRGRSERTRQHAELAHELRQSLRSDLLREIIDLVENEFSTARKLASEMQASSLRVSNVYKQLETAEDRLRKLLAAPTSHDGEVKKASLKVGGLEDEANTIEAELAMQHKLLADAHSAFKSKSLRAKFAAPKAIASKLDEISTQLSTIISEADGDAGVQYVKQNQDRISSLDKMRDELASIVSGWVHQ